MTNRSIARILAFILTATVAWAADSAPADAAVATTDAKPELRGVLATASEQRFNLANAGTGHSEWVSVGESFGPWKLAEYRPADSTLVLQKDDGSKLELSLAASHVGVDDEKATLADAESVLRKMNFSKMFAKTMEQQMKSMAAMTKQIAGSQGLNADPKIYEEYQKKSMDLIMSAFSPDQMESDMAQAYSEVFTKDQLTGLGDFFDSPVGQAYTDEMPAVNQKIQATMMPRLMALMPQLQALGKQQHAAMQAATAAAPAAPAAPDAPASP